MTNEEKQLFEDEVVLKTIKKLNEYYYLTPRSTKLTVENVSSAIQSIFITACQMKGKIPEVVLERGRGRDYVYIRQLTFYACKKLLHNKKTTFKIIGSSINPSDPFDHATVLYGAKNIGNLYDTDPMVKKDVDNLLELIIKTKSDQLSKFIVNGK